MKVMMISREDESTMETSPDFARERLEPNWYIEGTVDGVLAEGKEIQLASCSFVYHFIPTE